MNGKRVIVAMSGGVDSSVAAYLLTKEGYKVIGVTMDLLTSSCRIQRPDTCCGLLAFEDVMRVAEKIGIPHHILDVKDEFEKEVIIPFLSQYLRGQTPNPCILCNEKIKFNVLQEKAGEWGTDFLATGHYARIERVNARYTIKKAKDSSKDQSYFLYSLNQKQLSRCLFPLGDYRKEEVRDIAHNTGLGVAEKEESQEICFIPNNDYKEFLKERAKDKIQPGPIMDREGNILGEHEGIAFHTIGQRRGLGLATGRPLYVVRINPEDNTLTVGEEGNLYQDELVAEDVNWMGVGGLASELQVSAKIRYLHKESEALIYPMDKDKVRVKFKKPQRAITPGQSVVFYQDDVILGGGCIKK